jgi:hypothetical protein
VDQKEINFFSQLYFFKFLVIKILYPDSLEILDPDPDSINLDPQHWFLEAESGSAFEWTAGSELVLKSKFRSFRGSKWILERSK